MWERVFLKRLRRELPLWVEKGWVAPEQGSLMLDDMAARIGGMRHIPLAFAVLGTLLFGAGVITFFSANWAIIPKLVKLALLFGSMWVAFGGAGWLLTSRQQTQRGLAHALVLLGVILYGANIMLIAQIYHIQSHFPNGVLLWALGALVMTYFVPSQIVAVSGLALTMLWAGLDISGNLPTPIAFAKTVYWPFVVVLALFLPLIVQRAWRYAAWLAVLGFTAWCVVSLVELGNESDADTVHVLHVGLLIGFAVFLLSAVLEQIDRWELLGGPLHRLAAFFAMVSFYGLTISRVHSDNLLSDGFPTDTSVSWAIGTVFAVLLVVVSFAWWRSFTPKSVRDPYPAWGYVLLSMILLLILVSLFVPAISGAPTLIYLAFNILFLGTVVWLIYTGYRRGDRFRVNGGFLFFAISLVTIYFDNFWALLDRSFFFMGAGLLLLGGGFLLERQRRRLVRTMAPPHDPPLTGGTA